MSSEKANDTQRRLSVARPTASIARSISWGFSWRRFRDYLLEDIVILLLLCMIFAWHCTQSLPPAALDGITFNIMQTQVVRPDACVFTGTGANLATWQFIVHGADGKEHVFALAQYVSLLTPYIAFWLFCQV